MQWLKEGYKGESSCYFYHFDDFPKDMEFTNVEALKDEDDWGSSGIAFVDQACDTPELKKLSESEPDTFRQDGKNPDVLNDLRDIRK